MQSKIGNERMMIKKNSSNEKRKWSLKGSNEFIIFIWNERSLKNLGNNYNGENDKFKWQYSILFIYLTLAG